MEEANNFNHGKLLVNMVKTSQVDAFKAIN